jgi:hypothetical protein
MKNKNNILIRIWRAIVCADYIENYAEIKAKAESESVVVARDDSDDPMQMLHPSEDDANRVLGGNSFNWRLSDEWPLDIIDGEAKPKIAVNMDARAFMFHISTWAIVTGRRQRNLCVSIRNMRDNNFNILYKGILLLPEGEEYEAFQLWWKEYVERFGLQFLNDPPKDGKYGEPQTVEIFPEIPDSFTLEGTAFNHEGMTYIPKSEFWNPSNELFKQWCWIVENCKGKVWVTSKHFIFEDNADAVLFKLINPEDKL